MMTTMVKKAMGEGVTKTAVVSYGCLAIWIFCSATVILFNKYILDPRIYNWPFPISLTMLHMAFCSAIATALIRLGYVNTPHMTRRIYISSVFPIGFLYAASLCFSNSAYMYLSVSFIQMLKAIMPVAVYSISVALKRDSFRWSTMLNMLFISFGVAIAVYGEARFNARGVFFQLSALACEAIRLVLIEIFLTSKGIKFNPFTTLYYVAPCCLAFLAFPWLLLEYPELRAASPFDPHLFDMLLFGANCVCAFALNLAVFLLVGKTSALTLNVSGIVKDWILIAISWSVIRDSLTPVNLLGYAVSFVGVACYNHLKLQALKTKEKTPRPQVEDDEMVILLDDTEPLKHSEV